MFLGDFMKQLVALLNKKHAKIPFEDEKPWHEFFFKLQQSGEGEGRPKFLNQIRFDWDGTYPKSQKISDFLHALHWNASISAFNPRFDKVIISEEICELWLKDYDGMDQKTKNFFEKATKLATETF